LSNCFSPETWRRGLAALALALSLAAAWVPRPAIAAPTSVEPFDAEVWHSMQAGAKTGHRARLVVFSATWCAVCPGVINQLADDPRRTRAGVPLVVVLTDVGPGEADTKLLATPHYQRVDRLFAFDGQAAAIRYAVEPTWRGSAPFIAWLVPGQRPQFAQGLPPVDVMERWLTPTLR
jgi:hypothetical protein